MTPGTCQYCGCVEDRACEGGCSWANEECTLCTLCEWSERIATIFASVSDKQNGLTVVEWEDRSFDQRKVYVMVSRAVFDVVREAFLESIGEEAAAAAEELARLAVFLQQKYQGAVARAGEDDSAVDVAIELLGEKRIVLAEHGL